jgi:hypothetical protein
VVSCYSASDAHDSADTRLGFHFHSNERNEPIHVHCSKADAEAKYWLDIGAFEIAEAYAYGMSPADRRTVRSIIFQHFDYIVAEWNRFQDLKDD